MDEITVTDLELGFKDFFKDLAPSAVSASVRDAMLRVGEKVRQKAIGRLHSHSDFRTPSSMDEGVRTVLFSKIFGFKVTIKPKQGTSIGYYRNRQGKLKPVLAWAETGTESRLTRRGSHNRGKMKAYPFMPTEEELASVVETDMWQEIEKAVENAAKKNGLV